MIKKPTSMILAAGPGTRMRPWSDTTPKPLLEINGKALIEYSLARMEAVASMIVVNAHYKSAMMVDYCRKRIGKIPIRVIVEEQPLDSGGGVANALDILGHDPFFLANGDVIWNDGKEAALRRLIRFWDGSKMDALLLLIPCPRAFGCAARKDGNGDFVLADDGRLTLPAGGKRKAGHVFSGIQMMHPRAVAAIKTPCFPLSRIYHQAARDRRLYGLEHDGPWHHVGDAKTYRQLRAADDATDFDKADP